MDRIIHPIKPIYDKNSEILILGSFPSVKSREEEFFYAHPQNRFWRVLAAVYQKDVPKTTADKKIFLTENKIALWDVLASCEIKGSSDSSIKNISVNDISPILKCADIKRIFTNGTTAYKYYTKYIEPVIKRSAVCLPSTSPANAAKNLESLCSIWQALRL